MIALYVHASLFACILAGLAIPGVLDQFGIGRPQLRPER